MTGTIVVMGFEYRKTPALRKRISENLVKASALVEREERYPKHLIDQQYLASLNLSVEKLQKLLEDFDA